MEVLEPRSSSTLAKQGAFLPSIYSSHTSTLRQFGTSWELDSHDPCGDSPNRLVHEVDKLDVIAFVGSGNSDRLFPEILTRSTG